jgi:hypothetical protein
LTDKSHTVKITLKPFSGKGLSKLLVKLSSEEAYPNSRTPESYDNKIELQYGQDEVTLDLH